MNNFIEIIVDDLNEDVYLQSVASEGYKYAIVTRAGHSFLDKEKFLKELEDKNFFIIGHILDREPMNAYYELHEQCYVINLNMYKLLRCPAIGQQAFNSPHKQNRPHRSDENFHDDYTPHWVLPGRDVKQYEHKAHGWNILSLAFKNDFPVLVFDETMRATKEFNYEANR